MYIILLGGGNIGRYLCKEFLNMGHEVLVIEQDAKKCEHLKEELGSISLCGDGCEIALLTKAGIARANMLIAVTDEDDDNLAVCQIAKRKFNVPQVIAKLNNPKNEHIFEKLGIDHTVDTAVLFLDNIKAQTSISPLAHLLRLKERGLEIVLAMVPEGSPVIGTSLKDLPLPAGSTASLLLRQESQMLSPDTILQAGDQVICSIPSGSEETVEAMLASSQVI